MWRLFKAGGQVRGRLSQSHDLFNTSSPDAQFGPISVTPRRSCLGGFMQQEKQARAEISGCAGTSAAEPPQQETGANTGMGGSVGSTSRNNWTFYWTNKHFRHELLPRLTRSSAACPEELVWLFMAVFPLSSSMCPDPPDRETSEHLKRNALWEL